MNRRLLGGFLGAVVMTAWACGGSNEPPSPTTGNDIDDNPPVQRPEPDAGTQPDAGTGPDAGTQPDGGTQPDAGT
ncbi:hypothetical protein ACLEPN_41990, partial [Myxococcus sp. 1LA]